MRNRDRQSREGGFTLVEVAVSFVLLLMLSSLSVAGVLAYQDFADYKRQNDYAKTLFTAAQSKLIGYSVNGQTEQLDEVNENVLDTEKVITPLGEKASESEKGLTAKSGEIYILYADRESYEAYQNGELGESTDKKDRMAWALYDILDEFLMDKSILNACIAIEYNPRQGIVYSVLYSDKCGSFSYTAKSKNDVVNVLDRQDEYRREYMIGYYGLD